MDDHGCQVCDCRTSQGCVDALACYRRRRRAAQMVRQWVSSEDAYAQQARALNGQCEPGLYGRRLNDETPAS